MVKDPICNKHTRIKNAAEKMTAIVDFWKTDLNEDAVEDLLSYLEDIIMDANAALVDGQRMEDALTDRKKTIAEHEKTITHLEDEVDGLKSDVKYFQQIILKLEEEQAQCT